jgi:TPR repeat protein
MLKQIFVGLLLSVVAGSAFLRGESPRFRLGQLPAYTLSDVSADPAAKRFASLFKAGKFAEAVAAAEEARSKGQPMGDFLLGLAAEEGTGGDADPIRAEKHYRDGSGKNHPPSIVNLAALILRRNPASEEAAALLRSVVDREPRIAGFFLGVACLGGAGGRPDFDGAAEAWKAAGKAGNSAADRHLGLLYQGVFGFSERKDLEQAADAFRRAAEARDAEACIRLGILLLQSAESAAKESELAKGWFEKGVALGNASALYLLAQVREQGLPGLAADAEAARALYRRAADLGHGPSQVRLGNLLAKGIGGEADLKAAIKMYRQAAELGEGEAYFNLAALTQRGEGLEKSETEAFKLFLLAGSRDFEAAANAIGVAYRLGRGTPTDHVAAIAWFSRAAEAGNTDAMVSLAEMMLSNQGVPFNGDTLGQLTQRAFGAKNPRAGLLLARLAERGVAERRDPAKALALYRWTARHGLPAAAEEAARIETTLSREELASADRMLKELPPDEKP